MIKQLRTTNQNLISVGPADKNVILNSLVAPKARYELTIKQPKTGIKSITICLLKPSVKKEYPMNIEHINTKSRKWSIKNPHFGTPVSLNLPSAPSKESVNHCRNSISEESQSQQQLSLARYPKIIKPIDNGIVISVK